MEIIQKLEDILELPEKINGLEVQCPPSCLPIEGNDIVIYVETCRIFQEVYMHIISARYCLLVANETEHPEICKDIEGYKWFRVLNVNTAIMWYNAAFDILLQSLWIYKELYKKHRFGSKKKPLYYDKINSNTLSEILKGCSIAHVNEYLNNRQVEKVIKSFIDAHPKIHELGNSLKHRNSVKYKDFYSASKSAYTVGYYYEENGKFQINPDGYNSSDTLILEDFDDIISNLKDYHVGFIGLIDKIYVFLNFDKVLVESCS